jgi:hypothetical protein
VKKFPSNSRAIAPWFVLAYSGHRMAVQPLRWLKVAALAFKAEDTVACAWMV